MLANGCKSRDVAVSLSISAETVDTYRRRAMDKLRFEKQVDMVKRAIAPGLTSLG